jgi:hypothetical protein
MRTSPLPAHASRPTLPWLLLLAAWPLGWTGGAASAGPSEAEGRTLWSWQERYVRIAPQATPGAPPNDHPVELTPTQVGAMLDALQMTRPAQKRLFTRAEKEREGDALPVFSDAELEVLSETLSEGLAEAGPREDLVFLTVGNYDYAFGGVLKERQANAGRAFFRDGRLNVIFGAVHGQIREARGAGALVAYPAQIPEPGVRARPSETDPRWRLLDAPGVTLHRGEAGERGDWVLIDPETTLAGYEQRRAAAAQAGADESRVRDEVSRVTAEQERLRQEVEQLQREVRAPTPAAEAPAPAAAPAPAPRADASLEERLRTLKRLREQDLISEDIYKAKVEELLDQSL